MLDFRKLKDADDYGVFDSELRSGVYLGTVTKVPQHPSWGSSSRPVSGDTKVWVAVTPEGSRVGVCHRTRKSAGEALARVAKS